MAAGFLAALFIVPGYAFVGGWRYGLAVAPIVVAGLVPDGSWVRDEEVFALLFASVMVASVWKSFSACVIRNRLLCEQGLPKRDFTSWRYALFALCALLLGICVCAAAAAMTAVAISGLSEPDNPFGLRLAGFLAVPISVWLTELAAGRALVGLSEAIWAQPNPFLVAQNVRWRPLAGARRSTAGSSGMPFIPTWREAMQAILLPVAIVFVALLGAI